MLPYGRQLIEADDIEAVTHQLKSDWLTQGPAVAKFEESLCLATGARHAVAVSSGTAALHLACLAAGLKAGETGITSTVTFVASANCMRYVGARPALADVDPTTGLVSVQSMRAVAARLAAEGNPPKIFIPVDLAGSVADLEAVQALAKEHGAFVIEDAAHSLGASYRARDGAILRAGACVHSDLAILSFHPVKHITTGEGGAILTNDEGTWRQLLELRTHGITKDPARLTVDEGPWYYEQQSLGFHYRITDLQCALGSSQARKLERFVARRRAIARRYDLRFKALEASLTPLRIPDGVESSYHLYVVRLLPQPGEPVQAVAARRRALFEGLRAKAIAPQVHYIPVHRQPDFRREGLGAGEFPGADTYYSGCISLPMFPAMRDEDVDAVADAVGELVLRTAGR